MNEPVMIAEELSLTYGEKPVLWDVSFSVPCGKLVAVLGPNGAGKSSLLKAALGMVKPFLGRIHLPSAKKGSIAYVPQRETVDWGFPITALDLVLMGRYGGLRLFQRPNKEDKKAAQAALDRVGLRSLGHRQISELSGGQQQRLFIARALVQNPEIFFMDEPFSGVDIQTQSTLLRLIQTIVKEEDKSFFIVHHDLPSVRDYFDWAILLNVRLIANGPKHEVLTEENLIQAFGDRHSLFEEVANMSYAIKTGIPNP